MTKNPMEWEDVTEHEELQKILHDFLEDGVGGATGRLASWLENNLAGCAAVVAPGRMYLSNGDPGYPDEYCDNLVAPGHGEYCEEHEEP